jgi:hypothetical protein
MAVASSWKFVVFSELFFGDFWELFVHDLPLKFLVFLWSFLKRFLEAFSELFYECLRIKFFSISGSFLWKLL